MNIGFVSTWLHRGAAYVTINYAKLAMKKHNVFIYGRGGEYFDDSLCLDGAHITRGVRVSTLDGILYSDFAKWIQNNHIDLVIWNEQRDLSVLCKAKLSFPGVIHGAYIDYYKENTVNEFELYDFLICNTRRHYSVFEWHKQCFYMPWGCDVNLYYPQRDMRDEHVVFFHSMGMSNRKGTKTLIDTFLANQLGKRSKLIIHTQIDIDKIIPKEDAEKGNIEIVKGTVPAPGLYHKGDVYVYPATLDGLGLTLYEAISCGLPVIATDVGPMNEVINANNGYLVSVEKYYSRSDGYYWPLAVVDKNSLLDAMNYYIEHFESIDSLSIAARKDAVQNWNLENRSDQFESIIEKVNPINNHESCELYLKKYADNCRHEKQVAFTELFLPKRMYAFLKTISVNMKRGKK